MTLKHIASSAALGLALVATSQATTIVNITGATAFRTAAINSLSAAFAAGGTYSSGYVDNGKGMTGATYQIFSGTFPGISGQTIVRCSWNGSVEGVRALANTPADDAAYLTTAMAPASGTSVAIGSGTAAFQTASADLAFSDVSRSSTPVTTSLAGGPIGVVVFTMVANKQWATDGISSTVSSITNQQFRAIAGGPKSLSMLTGTTGGNNDKKVYLVGRNDGSGTRTTYLAETGYGITSPVTQYVNHNLQSSTSGNLTDLVLTAAGGTWELQTSGSYQYKTAYASTVWGLDQDGNGGYDSGGLVANILKLSSTSTGVDIYFGSNSADFFQDQAPDKVYLVSWLGYGDAVTARSGGAQILGYNGVILNDLLATGPSTISTADRALVANGRYTAWGFEQLLHKNTSIQQTVYNELKTRLNSASVIGTAGMALGEMNVTRATDGATVVPK